MGILSSSSRPLLRGLVALACALSLLCSTARAQDEPGAPAPTPSQPAAGGGGGGGGGGEAPAAADPTEAIPGVPAIPSAGLGGPTPPPAKQAAAGWALSGSFGGSVLFEKLAEDYYATLDLYNQTRIGPISFGIWVPLRFRVIDSDPEQDGVMRKEDWDEPSDFARIFRFIEVNLGGERWRFRGRFGALDGESLGHGTIVAGYFNNIDRNHYQAGLLLDTAVKWGGLAFMLDNLISPEIFAFRLHTRPASFFTDNKWANRALLSFSVAADTNAPVALRAQSADPTLPEVDGEGNYLYTDNIGVSLVGFDLEYTLVQNKLIDLVPYVDLNFLFDKGSGAGFHLGTFFNLRVPLSIGPRLFTRLEYRAIGDGYAPRYIDSTYEAQRVQYATGDLRDAAGQLPLTKLGWLRCSADPTQCTGLDGAATGTKHGWLGELYFDFAGWVQVGGSFEDYQGPNNAALTLGLHLPKFPFAQVGAYYSRRGFDGLDEAFDLDGALLLAYARAKVYGPLALTAVYTRSWKAGADGSYEAQSDFSVGVGVAIGY